MKRLKCRKFLFSLCIIVSHKIAIGSSHTRQSRPTFLLLARFAHTPHWKARQRFFFCCPIDGRMVYVKVNLNANSIVAVHVAIYRRLINVLWSISPGVQWHYTSRTQFRWVSCIYDVFKFCFCSVIRCLPWFLFSVLPFFFFYSCSFFRSGQNTRISLDHTTTVTLRLSSYTTTRRLSSIKRVYSSKKTSSILWSPVTTV